MAISNSAIALGCGLHVYNARAAASPDAWMPKHGLPAKTTSTDVDQAAGPIPPTAVACLLHITRLECNMIAAPFASQLNSAQLQNTLHQIQSLTSLRCLCLKVKALSGLQHFSSLTNLTVLKLDTATANYESLSDLRVTNALSNLTIRYWPRYNIKSQRITVKDAYGFQTVNSVVKDTLLEATLRHC